MLNKKSQAAMEFLMTYGWAIMIVLIGIGALFFLGVFNPSTPAICNIASPFVCQDVAVRSGNGIIYLKIAATNIDSASISNIRINSITCPNTNAASAVLGISVNGVDNTNTAGADISTVRTGPVTITCSWPGSLGFLAEGIKVSGSYDISWTKQFGVSHKTVGTFSGTVEP